MRLSNLPNRFHFPIDRPNLQYALPTSKSFSSGESEGAGLLRRLPGAGTAGDGGVGLSIELHLFEIPALVPLVREQMSLGARYDWIG